ncbi:TPA: hypothetical protein VEM46_002791 [Pseudomonas aeruginosa]|nr:hypothetical protein [Pseudomonas aeruginosa]HEQ1691149.1 hypothetical protein [Pseudomonas aeruginosa]HEQ1727404.1 hypothetical protein [Pseudomonas aeruginosa]HEQ1731884.1 hypothetical protein [Pseudomonas aeruginosa]HEQ1786217.1 hypothetical protein [Pseudomonas aeruginosa]
MKQHDENEPFFITEEAEAEMIAAGYEFEPPAVPCTVRLRDVLEGMSDAELALQPGEIADQERMHRQNKSFSVG